MTYFKSTTEAGGVKAPLVLKKQTTQLWASSDTSVDQLRIHQSTGKHSSRSLKLEVEPALFFPT